MTLEVDWSCHLVKAEQEWSKVYPLLTQGRDASAILSMLESMREQINALEFLIREASKRGQKNEPPR
jgi:hypothetical protein